jgi:thioredoxin 1
MGLHSHKTYSQKGNGMAGNVIELTDENFDDAINSDMPVLVDFWAPWCGPCRMIAPIVEEISEDYAGKAKICKLNTDDARDSAMEFGINAIPTLILFKGGQIEKKWVGLTSKKNITEAIDELL